MSSSLIDNYQCYIGCLHHSIGDEEFMTLAKCFSTNVISTKLIRGQSSSSHLGYGFVQYTDFTASDEAILLMQGIYSKGIPLVIRSTSNYTNAYNYDNTQPADTTQNNTVNTTVHVSNLSDQDTQDSINDLAKPFGDIESINFIPDKTISCFWALHSNEPKSYDKKLLDKEKEDEVYYTYVVTRYILM
eukprot:XP_765812.1 hypothetical protein [Theileria parva strain Muguga]